MRYSYFGNTSNRVEKLLYNFETQLILFNELFQNAQSSEVWANDSSLQMRYLELLREHKLIESKANTKALGTKDARVKSAPLEDYKLINRKEKRLTEQGLELLDLIHTEGYKRDNEFLQIDLISLFFIKASLNFSKDSLQEGLFERYLEVFRFQNGELSLQDFKLLPLIDNFSNTQDFLTNKQNALVDYAFLQDFLRDMKVRDFKPFYFKTAKGMKSALEIINALQHIFLPLKAGDIESELALKMLSKHAFKKPYLDFLLRNSQSKKDRILALQAFIQGDIEDFAKRFYELIFMARVDANLEDYLDLNRRYLNLCGIFEFSSDKVSLSPLFRLIMRHSQYKEILHTIKQGKITPTLLNERLQDEEFSSLWRELGITRISDVKHYKRKQDIIKLKALLQSRFTKDKVSQILRLFEDRKNDSKIAHLVSTEATIPTIFEYLIALAWCYIDERKFERILDAGLSLDSHLLPKSHAVGGNADFVYSYENHTLMIEVTLTEKTNQRRAEMESVSRHLGNLLLSLDSKQKQESYGIFIAPYLDRNVLNDFRSRLNCYFENDTAYICGMKILPLSTSDISKILESNLTYTALCESFQTLLASENVWGSKWYCDEVRPYIEGLDSKANDV